MIDPMRSSIANRLAPTSVAAQTALLFVLIITVRVCYVSLFAVATPFWDQWDAEAFYLLKPWHEGTWQLAQLFSPHNEHRIAFTRVLSLLVFEANGRQWNNLVSAYLNCALAAIYLALLFAVLARDASPTARLSALAAVTIAGVLPFGWENFLVGFQSQFYFMAWFAIVAVASAARGVETYLQALALGVMVLAGLFTSAGGVIAAASVFTVIMALTWHRQCLRGPAVLALALMLILMAAGLWLTPSLADHDTMKAQGLRDNFTALTTAFMWPIEPRAGSHFRPVFRTIAVIALWAPSAVWAWHVLRRRETSRSAFFALGMSAWAAAQAVAIAHSRGHDMSSLPSRYMDIPAIAMVSNAWLAAELVRRQHLSQISPSPPRALVATAAAFFVVLGFGLWTRGPADMAKLSTRSHFSGRETANVAAYLRTGDAAWLNQPSLEIPYPDPERLKMLLDDDTIHGMLPAVLLGAAAHCPAPALSAAADALQNGVRHIIEAALPGVKQIEPDLTPQHKCNSAEVGPRLDQTYRGGKDRANGLVASERFGL